ncbi:glycine cleavage system protein T [Planctomyces sp. SCGC AG-212-M04]|nr:glycine cleavage system protein T [Planctomyces sp. SCGC AG-212-M04]
MEQTVLHDWHQTHHGRMVDFAGWSMPVQYSSIVEEHNAVRQNAGLFDISHMGRLEFQGPDAVKFLDHLLTNEVSTLKPGQVRYSLVCREDGGILDDVLVYRVEQSINGEPTHLLVVNASNRPKILDWIKSQRSGFNVTVIDRTSEWSMIALQGPKACGIFADYGTPDPAPFKYYTCWKGQTPHGPAIVSRTGYTGEDGIELMVPSGIAVAVWTDLMSRGRDAGILPCGLGCRDTLRLEAAMPLYGHELSEEIDPLTAGLQFAVKLTKTFVGQPRLAEIAASPLDRVRVGLALDGKRIAREHTPVKVATETIGEVTSGTFSPTLQKTIGMAYVSKAYAQPGTRIEVDLRGKLEPGQIVPLPFYRRPKT